MLSHVTLGTNDLARAVAFHDATLAPLGIGRLATEPEAGLVGYALAPDRTPRFWIMRPIDGHPATVGNGATLGFKAADRATVDAFHAAALRAGGTDEGAPGLRPHYHPDYYGATMRDLDGNKLCCVCHRPA